MGICIFCLIVRKEQEADIVFESNKVIAFKSISPKAPVHILIVPKEHIASVADITESHKELMGELLLVAHKVALQFNLKGYKLQYNVGAEGGQEVYHLHLHLLGNPKGNITELPV